LKQRTKDYFFAIITPRDLRLSLNILISYEQRHLLKRIKCDIKE